MDDLDNNQTINNKHIQKDNNSVSNMSNSKKIGFFSAMLIAFGSCVGAGIFFKADSVLNNSSGSFVLAFFSWILASIIVMSMALALIEVSSARNDNLSLIGWCKTFNSRTVYKACKNFMFYIYCPLTYFFMPLYAIMSLQDGITAITGSASLNTDADWSIMMVIAIVMSSYFLISCGLSAKIGNIQNLVITSLKFIPLILAVVFAIWNISLNPNIIDQTVRVGFIGAENIGEGISKGEITFGVMSPGFGLFIAIGAIFFAYDGFYVTAGLQTEMKQPQKTPIAIFMGLLLVTIVYLSVAISMSLGGNFQEFLKQGDLNGTNQDLSILFAIYNILIGIGVIGIINGFALWTPRFCEDLIKENELPFSKKAFYLIKTKFYARPVIGTVYNLIISIPIIIIFCIIGGLGYINSGGYEINDYGSKGLVALYSFADLMANWTTAFAFLFIIISIVGALANRRTKKVATINLKIFKPFAFISVTLGGIAIAMTFFQPFFDLFLIFAIDSTKIDNVQFNETIISRTLLVVIFFLKVILMLLPTMIEDFWNFKKYGSIEKAQKIS